MGKKMICSVMAVAAMSLLSSCEYQNLGDAEVLQRTAFSLGFDHSAVDSVPKEYRVAFYPDDEQTRENITAGYMLFDLTTGEREIILPAGNYKVTAWNHDTEHVITEGYGVRNNLQATTNHYRSRGNFYTPRVIDSLYAGHLVLDYPDYMTHANVESFTLRSGIDGQRLILRPDSMVVTVNVNIGGVRGLSDVIEARGSIDNVPASRYMAYDNLTADSAVVIFDCNVHPAQNRIAGTFYLFGLEPTDFPNLHHRMILYFWMNTGRVYIPLDITRLVAAARDSKVLNIDLPDLDIDLREFVTPGSGYDVSVDDWDNIIIDMNL